MAGGVLALDLSSKTGWAIGRLPEQPLTPMEMAVIKPKQPLSGVAHFHGELGLSLDAFERWLNQMVDRHAPDGLVFESPVLPKYKTTPTTVRKLMSLAGITLMICHQRKILWVKEIQPRSMKKHVSGNGGPGKENVKNAIRSFGWTYESDDEADALGLLVMAGDLYAAERRAAA